MRSWTTCHDTYVTPATRLYHDEEQVGAGPTGETEREIAGTVSATGESPTVGGRRFVRLQADDGTWTIEAPNVQSFGVLVGAAVTLRFRYWHRSAYGSSAQLALFSAGKLAFWYSLDDRKLAEGWSYSWGAEQCRHGYQCGTFARSALVVRGPCGDEVEIAPRGQGEVCGYAAIVGATDRTLQAMRGLYVCPDVSTVDKFELTLVNQPSSSAGDDAGT